MPKFENVVEAYFEQNGMFCFTGESGVTNLTRLVGDLGYRSSHTDTFANFLAANPGCMGAIIRWIQTSDNEEWEDNLLDQVDPKILATYE